MECVRHHHHHFRVAAGAHRAEKKYIKWCSSVRIINSAAAGTALLYAICFSKRVVITIIFLPATCRSAAVHFSQRLDALINTWKSLCHWLVAVICRWQNRHSHRKENGRSVCLYFWRMHTCNTHTHITHLTVYIDIVRYFIGIVSSARMVQVEHVVDTCHIPSPQQPTDHSRLRTCSRAYNTQLACNSHSVHIVPSSDRGVHAKDLKAIPMSIWITERFIPCHTAYFHIKLNVRCHCRCDSGAI